MLTISLDASALARIAAAMKAAGERTPDAIRRAVNWTGDRTKTKVVRSLTKQTGLKRKTVVAAVRPRRASYGDLEYVMRAAGGNVALKFFAPRETRAGVSAAPWGHRQVFRGSFLKGGLFPNRKPLPAFGGQVMYRFDGAGRFPVKVEKSGLFIPVEMTKGDTAEVFAQTVAALLPARVEHEVAVILAGIVA